MHTVRNVLVPGSPGKYGRLMFNADPSRPPVLNSKVGMPSQGGAGLTIDSISLLREGRRWFPVMGEYHFSRDLPERWEHELRKMKAGGINVVATYLMWILHEERRGSRSWDGHLDVRRFVEAAKKAGLDVVMRIGPWAHGEARNGGFPDWLQELPIAHRTNDPEYLALTREWYEDIAVQLLGLFRSEENSTGPIIAVQVDNELYDQPEHLSTLRDLAESVGMNAPFWVATGWGGAQVPLDVLIPVYAGYSDGFWEESDVEAPAFAKMHFAFSDVRDDLSVGADVRYAPPTDGLDDRRYPFITCELGGGMAVAYHRRPHVDSADVGALALTKLGSGSAWQGYYVYHGTVQATGELTGMQESHDSDYPNDLPTKDYDFFAPIGSAGTIRPHYHFLRKQHLFLHQWGAELLELPAVFPDADDVGVRTSIRLKSGSGYVFANNHQPSSSALEDVEDFQFQLADGQALPGEPVVVPAGTYFLWPVRQSYGDVMSLSGTVQPITQIGTESGLVVIFGKTDGIAVELDIDSGGSEIRGAHSVATAAGTRWVPEVDPGADCIVTVGTTKLVILDTKQSDSLWAGTIAGQDVVVLWEGGLVFEDDQLTLERWTPQNEVLTIPAANGASEQLGPFHRLILPAFSNPINLPVRAVAEAASAPALRRGGTTNRFSAPLEREFNDAAVFEISVPVECDHEAAQVLSIEWAGDVARAFVGDELISDQFWYGRTWEIDVKHIPGLKDAPLRIQILPWNGETDFFVDRRVRSQRVAGRAEIVSAELLTAPRYPVSFTR